MHSDGAYARCADCRIIDDVNQKLERPDDWKERFGQAMSDSIHARLRELPRVLCLIDTPNLVYKSTPR
jgi:hypothetical protein